LPDSDGRNRCLLDFLLKLGPAAMVVHGMQSAEAEEIYRRAAEIGESLDAVGPLYKATMRISGARPRSRAIGRGSWWLWRGGRTTAISCSKPIIAVGPRRSFAARSAPRSHMTAADAAKLIERLDPIPKRPPAPSVCRNYAQSANDPKAGLRLIDAIQRHGYIDHHVARGPGSRWTTTSSKSDCANYMRTTHA